MGSGTKPRKSHSNNLHCKKRLSIFLSPVGMSLTRLFQARESLVNDIPAGDGTIDNLFLQCIDFATLSYPLVRVEAVLTTRSLAGAAAAVIERGRPRLPGLAARATGRPAVLGSVVTPPLLCQSPQNFLLHKHLSVPPLLKC